MSSVPYLLVVARTFDLKIITNIDLIYYRKKHDIKVTREAETMLATNFGKFKMIGYSNNLDQKEHLALIKGEIDSNNSILTRVHSECLTGDVFNSFRCDCGPQLEKALQIIEERGSGIVIYMRQEGRGIGLFNKLRAYQLQDEGLDTVEANHKLGFKDDLREYEISAEILKDLQVNVVELLTNNPKKIDALKACQINVVKRVPIEVKPRKDNNKYLQDRKSVV